MHIAQDTTAEAADCEVKVSGHLCDGVRVLIDTGCTMELNLSEDKALQLGITAEMQESSCELGDGSSSDITCR